MKHAESNIYLKILYTNIEILHMIPLVRARFEKKTDAVCDHANKVINGLEIVDF